MKKLFILAALTGALASQTFAFTVDVSRMSGYYFGNGGEATITGMPASDPAFQAVLHNYSPLTSSSTSFQTFCINTSISVQANPQNASLDNSGVSMGAAWLYNQFARGVLAYSYIPGATRVASAGALQDAIWYLEGQVAAPTLGSGYVAIVDGLFGASGALAPSGGAFNVEALRLTHDGIVSQPMLALVPDGGSTILLLGFALSGLGLATRKFRS